MTEDLRQLGEKLLGKTSGNMKHGKETWWGNEDVEESIQTMKLAKITVDKDNNEENKAAYKTAKKEAKQSVAIAKARVYDRLYADMDTTEGQKRVLRMAKEREKNSKYIYQSKVIKDEEERMKMKNGKATGPDNIPVEVWKSLGRTGVHFLKEALNKITDEEKIPDICRKSILILIYKNKGYIMNCGNYRGITLMCHSMKLYERVHENRL